MCASPSAYVPRQPHKTILYQVVQETQETLLATCEQAGSPLPRFVEREFRKFLSCGILAEGFTRIRCPECGFERLLGFSCKGTSLCPSCIGRTMVQTAAHLPVLSLSKGWTMSFPRFPSASGC
jgi:hypothetical protein